MKSRWWKLLLVPSGGWEPLLLLQCCSALDFTLKYSKVKLVKHPKLIMSSHLISFFVQLGLGLLLQRPDVGHGHPMPLVHPTEHLKLEHKDPNSLEHIQHRLAKLVSPLCGSLWISSSLSPGWSSLPCFAAPTSNRSWWCWYFVRTRRALEYLWGLPTMWGLGEYSSILEVSPLELHCDKLVGSHYWLWTFPPVPEIPKYISQYLGVIIQYFGRF